MLRGTRLFAYTLNTSIEGKRMPAKKTAHLQVDRIYHSTISVPWIAELKAEWVRPISPLCKAFLNKRELEMAYPRSRKR